MSTDWRSAPGGCARMGPSRGRYVCWGTTPPRPCGGHCPVDAGSPPFTAYVSGHSTFSRASAEVLTACGIHFQDGDWRAREAGAAIWQQAYEWAEPHWDPFGEIADTVVYYAAPGSCRRVRSVSSHGWSTAQPGAFAAGRTVKACRLLEDLGAGVRPLAAAQRGRQHAWATDARCG